MIYMITDACINCDRCEMECPINAIFQGNKIYEIDQNKCNGCESLYDTPQCIEICPVDCISFLIVESSLTDNDPKVRADYASSQLLEPHQVDLAFADKDESVRLALVSHQESLNSAQIERALTDSSPLVRAAMARRIDCAVTRAQFYRGCEDPNHWVRFRFFERKDWVPDREQIEKSLTDASDIVKALAYERNDYTLNEQQIERGLTDPDPKIRSMVLHRKEFFPTEQQLERGLTDPNSEVRRGFAKCLNLPLSKEQFDQGLADVDSSVCSLFASRTDFTPSAEQVAKGLNSSKEVILAFARRSDIVLNQKQIERGLTDSDSDVRAAFASRGDFRPSLKQIERGLTDLRFVVRNAFYVRRDIQLTNAQHKRATSSYFNVERPSGLESWDESYIEGTSIQCPYCKARFIIESEESEYCEHFAFSYFPEYGIGVHVGATDEQKAWLGGSDYCTRKKFNLLCRTYKLKKRNRFADIGEDIWTVAFSDTSSD